MHPLRKKRLQLILFLVLGVSVAVGLMLYSIRQDINFFVTPTQISNGEIHIGQTVRLGGLVVVGSVKRAPDSLQVRFLVTDGIAEVSVFHDPSSSGKGGLPDLFREGQGVVVIGHIDENKIMQADQILAKHDEKYTPPEVKHALEKAHQSGLKKLESARE